jgi:hypothetical protein
MRQSHAISRSLLLLTLGVLLLGGFGVAASTKEPRLPYAIQVQVGYLINLPQFVAPPLPPFPVLDGVGQIYMGTVPSQLMPIPLSPQTAPIHDTGVIRFLNYGSLPVTINKGLRVTTGAGTGGLGVGCTFEIWDDRLPFILQPDQMIVFSDTFTQSAPPNEACSFVSAGGLIFNFDTSDFGTGVHPVVHVSLTAPFTQDQNFNFDYVDTQDGLLGHKDAASANETTDYVALATFAPTLTSPSGPFVLVTAASCAGDTARYILANIGDTVGSFHVTAADLISDGTRQSVTPSPSTGTIAAGRSESILFNVGPIRRGSFRELSVLIHLGSLQVDNAQDLQQDILCTVPF